MVQGGLRRREQLRHPPACHADGVGRARDVGDGDGEFAGAAREPTRGAADVLDPAERVKEVVELVGVVEPLALTGVGPDPIQPHQRVSLVVVQVDVREGVVIAHMR